LATEENSPPTATVTDRAERRGPMPALAHRDFRFLLAGNVFTGLGQWTQLVGKSWLVYELSGSTLQLGLVAFFQGIGMLLSPVGGDFADRFDRRKVMLASQVGMVVIGVTIAVLVLTDAVRIWHIYLMALLGGAVFAFNSPSRQSLVFDIVGPKDISNAVALNGISMNSMRLVGPTVAGVLIGTVGVGGTFFMQAGCFLVAAGTALMLRPVPFSGPRSSAPILQSIKDGFSYARKDRTITDLLMITYIWSFLGMAYLQLMAAYAGDVLGLDGEGFGYLMIAVGVGGMLGAAGIAVAGNFAARGKLLIGGVLSMGAMLMVLGASDILAVAIVALVGLGLGNTVSMLMSNLLLQTNVDDRYRGRVMSLFMISFAIVPLASLIGGSIAEAIGLRPVYIAFGALIVGLTLWLAMSSPRLRRL